MRVSLPRCPDERRQAQGLARTGAEDRRALELSRRALPGSDGRDLAPAALFRAERPERRADAQGAGGARRDRHPAPAGGAALSRIQLRKTLLVTPIRLARGVIWTKDRINQLT